MSRKSEARARLAGAQERNELARDRMDYQAPRFARLKGRHENGSAPVAISAFNLFPTPPEIAKRMCDLCGSTMAGLRVLEPSAGTGNLIRAILNNACGMECGVKITAVEINPALARGLEEQRDKTLYANGNNFKVLCGDFLDLRPVSLETGTFDRIVMNPPFCRGADIKHIRHAFTFLKPGGLLVAICAGGQKRRSAFAGAAEHYEELPAGTFKSEGTHVDTCLIVLRKADGFRSIKDLKAEDHNIACAEAAQKGGA